MGEVVPGEGWLLTSQSLSTDTKNTLPNPLCSPVPSKDTHILRGLEDRLAPSPQRPPSPREGPAGEAGPSRWLAGPPSGPPGCS